jgi:hypothetical protein
MDPTIFDWAVKCPHKKLQAGKDRRIGGAMPGQFMGSPVDWKGIEMIINCPFKIRDEIGWKSGNLQEK